MDHGPDAKAFKRLYTIHLLLVGATFELALRNSRVKERTLQFSEATISETCIKP